MLAKGATSVADTFFLLRTPPGGSIAATVSGRRTTEETLMIATKDSLEPHSSETLPNSRRVFAAGNIHKDVRVPMREIQLTPTKSFNGRIEANEPVSIYDTSGPWGDPNYKASVEEGLPAFRAMWIRARGDVEEYDGRPVRPIDDGYLSEQHRGALHARRQDETSYHLD